MNRPSDRYLDWDDVCIIKSIASWVFNSKYTQPCEHDLPKPSQWIRTPPRLRGKQASHSPWNPWISGTISLKTLKTLNLLENPWICIFYFSLKILYIFIYFNTFLNQILYYLAEKKGILDKKLWFYNVFTYPS